MDMSAHCPAKALLRWWHGPSMTVGVVLLALYGGLAVYPLLKNILSFPLPIAHDAAIAFGLACASVWAYGGTRARASCRVACGRAALVMTIALLAIVEYRWSAGIIDIDRRLIAPGVLTLGMIFARPERGLAALATTGGTLARRLLAAAILLPATLGGFALYGQESGLFGITFAVTMMAVGSSAIFVVLIWSSARALRRAEARGERAEEALRIANRSLEERVAQRTAELASANDQLETEIVKHRRSEQVRRALLDSAPDAIVITDAAGVILLINAKAERMFGYSRAELAAQSIDALLPDALTAPHEESAGATPWFARQTTGVPLELFARTKEGAEFPAGVNLSAVDTDDATLVFIDIRDITWRKNAERELRAREERFQAVTQTANDAIVSADAAGRISYFNPAAERIFGYEADEVIGQPLSLLVPPRWRDTHVAGYTRATVDDGPLHDRTLEVAGLRKDGSEVPLELSVAKWKAGDAIYITGLARDVSRRKRAEEEVRSLNERLVRRTAELEVLNRELESFSYSVSHDLRAPLRSIDGFSQAIVEDYSDRLDEQGRNYLGRVRAAAQRMGLLIDDLLTLARVTRTEIDRQHVDLSAMARDIAEELRRTQPERAAEIRIADGLRAVADPRLVRVALQNLLDNAWKFTARRDRATIEFGAADTADGVYFVRDDGAGFDAAYSGKLFGAFQRLHSENEFPGTGIGLATVQRVVLKHGGRVWAQGQVGKGATFFFSLE